MPFIPGISRVSRVYGDTAGGPPLKKLRSGGTLTDLTSDYVLFSYAPLFLYGHLTFNPIQEWINLNNHKQIVFILHLDHPILDLQDKPIFDHTLWAIEKRYWPSLSLHIGSLALLDRSKQTLTRSVCQEIQIIDVLSIDKADLTNSLPTIDIFTFGVDSNHLCIAFKPTKDLLLTQPRLMRFDPREETIKLANALFSHSQDPYSAVQPYPWEVNK